MSADSLYINSIRQNIPWAEIERTQIKMTKGNYVISIFLKDEYKVFNQPKKITSRILCALNSLISSTPFAFSTFTLQGRAVDIYNEIKSRQTTVNLKKNAS